MVSSLSRFGGLTQAQAVGTSLPSQVVTNIGAGLTFAVAGAVDPATAVCLGAASMLGARTGARLGGRMSEQQFKGVFGAVLLGLSPIMVLLRAQKDEKQGETEDTRPQTLSTSGPLKTNANPAPRPTEPAMTKPDWTSAWKTQNLVESMRANPSRTVSDLAVGAFVGVLSGAMGIGASPVMISYLTLTRKDCEYHTCCGTALCAVILTTFMGSVSHARQGTMQVRLLPLLALGATIGGIGGSSAALYLPAEKLQLVFAGFCAVTGGGMLRKSGLIQQLFKTVPKH